MLLTHSELVQMRDCLLFILLPFVYYLFMWIPSGFFIRSFKIHSPLDHIVLAIIERELDFPYIIIIGDITFFFHIKNLHHMLNFLFKVQYGNI